MATLKEHQAAMVDLLANGSGIPASASRLAHAMHDLIAAHLAVGEITLVPSLDNDATTPGLNDKALSDCVELCRPKAMPAERRVKELENTIKQLKGGLAKVRGERDYFKSSYEDAFKQIEAMQEQAARRKEDTQVCEHSYSTDRGWVSCDKCGKLI